MNVAALRRICLGFPGAFEDFPFGPETSVFKVRAAVAGGSRHEAKMFALSAMDPDDFAVSLKCEPALAEQLRSAHPEITGAWHLNKRHWNGKLLPRFFHLFESNSVTPRIPLKLADFGPLGRRVG